jgi:DNA-binding IclR family transcriptional regulator
LGILSDRSHFLSGKVRSFAVKGLRNRVLDYIRQHGAIINVAEAAEMLGVARPSLSRLLADLQAEGLVERTKEGGYIRNKRG